MKIIYHPSRDSEAEEWFLRTYVFPLGQPRARARLLPTGEALIQVNEAKCLSFARVCVLVASGINDDWEMTTAAESPSGSWYGDLEPGSVEFSVARMGPPLTSEFYELEIPEGTEASFPSRLPGSAAKVEVASDYFTIFANGPGFVSLARHLAALINGPPMGRTLRYEPGADLEPESAVLVIEKTPLPLVAPKVPRHDAE